MGFAARFFIVLGAINGALVIGLGAYGAHAPAVREHAALFQTAIHYHMFHALGLLAVGLLALRTDSSLLLGAGGSMLLGILLFCGTIYLTAITGYRGLNAITPVGGIAFLLAWILVAVAAARL